MKVADNPNLTANIGFVCSYPLHFYVFKNVYRHLPNAEFIVDPTSTLGVVQSPNLERELYDFFSQQQVHWRAHNPHTTHQGAGADFFSKYALIVSPQYRAPVSDPYNRDKKHVRMLYGNAKDPWNFGPWSAYYDLVLSYGPYSQERLAIYGNACVSGNAKFDEWFAGTVTASKHFPDSEKKTILYLPTWGDLNAAPLTISAIHQLSKTYNLIIKEHHMSHFFRPEEAAPFRTNPDIVIVDDRDDILPLLKEADVVLSDNSGAIFDAILADKPVVLIDNVQETLLDAHKQSLFYRQRGLVTGVATYRNSMEQILKRSGTAIGPVLKTSFESQLITADQLRAAFKEALQDEEQFRQKRRKVRDEIFAFNDGACGKRAAEAITELLHGEKPERSLLAESIDAYLRDYFPTRQPAFNNAKKLQELGNRYLWLKNKPYADRLRAVIKEFFAA